MFRNYLAAALRNLARNKLYAGINIIGLAVGFAAAILIALFVRDEFNYDNWEPRADSTYLVTGTVYSPGRAPSPDALTPVQFANWMRLDFPEIEAVARLSASLTTIKHGDIESNAERFYWADPNFFSIAEFPTIAGDLRTALERPDGLVITRSVARKYYGKDAPIGETIEINLDRWESKRKQLFTITAVIEDLPSNTHFEANFIASGRAENSNFNYLESMPVCDSCYPNRVYTYFRLKPHSSIVKIQAAMDEFFARHRPLLANGQFGLTFKFPLIALKDIHFHSELLDLNAISAVYGAPKSPGNLSVVYSVIGIGILIVLIASINFVNLMTARSSRRAIEVGIRKVSGAGRRDLIIQFIGEAILYVFLGMLLAISLVELSLSAFNAFLDRTIDFNWWRDPTTISAILIIIIFVGTLAGFYPGLVLSAFKPANVLKGVLIQKAGYGRARQTLVILQFAVLIGLVLSTGVIYRQTYYALHNGSRLKTDQVLLVKLGCTQAFQDAAAALPGVRSVTCSDGGAMGFGEYDRIIDLPDGLKFNVAQAGVDFGFLEFYGFQPLAGRFFARDHGGDSVSVDPNAPFEAPIVINEQAMRLLGFASPRAAIGKTVTIEKMRNEVHPSEIIGVVTDFAIDVIHKPVAPTIYYVDQTRASMLNIRTVEGKSSEILDRIKTLWNQIGPPSMAAILGLNQLVLGQYTDVIRQGTLFTIFAGVAVLIACLGLFGLSAFTAERRTKEIGIRKVMGATRWDIVKLLVWQFMKPVLWANLIAWPVSGYFMNRWLHGFAYHVDLEGWVFLCATLLALIIALATVSTHAFLVARALPARALRYE